MLLHFFSLAIYLSSSKRTIFKWSWAGPSWVHYSWDDSSIFLECGQTEAKLQRALYFQKKKCKFDTSLKKIKLWSMLYPFAFLSYLDLFLCLRVVIYVYNVFVKEFLQNDMEIFLSSDTVVNIPFWTKCTLTWIHFNAHFIFCDNTVNHILHP
jgi:hypothetical protein